MIFSFTLKSLLILVLILNQTNCDFNQCVSSINTTMDKTIQYSGKDFNDFGNMKSCNFNKSLIYYFAIISEKKPKAPTLLLGICINKNCTTSDLNYNLPLFLPTIEELLKNITKKDVDLSKYNFNIVNPSEVN